MFSTIASSLALLFQSLVLHHVSSQSQTPAEMDVSVQQRYCGAVWQVSTRASSLVVSYYSILLYTDERHPC